MKLYIKNMVSIRCKLVVKAELDKLGVRYTNVELGEAEIPEDISQSQREQFSTALKRWGLQLMSDHKAILVERIKNVIIEAIHYSDEPVRVNFSHYLSEKLNYNYTYLANLFSEIQGTTIEHFIIKHKIERVKELMVYEELSLSEVSYKLHYSSVAHLSSQFKKTTGLTPSYFRRIKHKRLQSLENV
jgi:YesN/AraC family two-component response regulator